MFTHTTARFRCFAVLAASLVLHGAVLCIPLSQQFTGTSATEDLPLLVTLTSSTAAGAPPEMPPPLQKASAWMHEVAQRRERLPRDLGGLSSPTNQSQIPPAPLLQRGVAVSLDEHAQALPKTLVDAAPDAIPAMSQLDAAGDTTSVRQSPNTPDTRIVLAQLRDTISRERYPELARRRGWEGEVQLGFRVEGSGAIDNIRVMHSSGNRLLDESAMRALQRIRSVPIELWLDGFSAELLLPVIYRLSES